MSRPTGGSQQDVMAQKRWDAWKAQQGLSKTEAKRRYISFLIDTMKTYASGTHEARELLEELVYLWDQIKDVSIEDEITSSYDNFNSLMSFNINGGYNNTGNNSLISDFNYSNSIYNEDKIRSHELLLLKKEVNLALSKIDEMKKSDKSGDNTRDKLFAILVSLLKFGFKLAKKLFINLVLAIVLLRLVKKNTKLTINRDNFIVKNLIKFNWIKFSSLVIEIK